MLVRSEILRAIEAHKILITPFEVRQLNPNSYNLRLARKLVSIAGVLDPKKPPTLIPVPLEMEGDPEYERWVLWPGQFYLGSTVEKTESEFYIPMINGRSSIARLGVSVHQTGGFGDIGFAGHWTLEITVAVPVYLYPNMQIAQICWFPPTGEVDDLYHGKYQGQEDAPVRSKISRELGGNR